MVGPCLWVDIESENYEILIKKARAWVVDGRAGRDL